MKQHIAQIALLVNDYDKAIQFYTQQLNFSVTEDTMLGEDKRWVVLAPPGGVGCKLLLAKAVGERQQKSVGDQAGGRVFLFLYTDNFWRDYNDMVSRKVNFVRLPVKENYGTVAVFEDLYGNLWDLIEPV